MTMFPIRRYATIGAALIVGVAAIRAGSARQHFRRHLDRIAGQIREAGAARKDRDDLPPEVVALAARHGVSQGVQSDFATFDQSGQMWPLPGGTPMSFRAHQTVRLDAPGFLWRAVTDLPKSIVVADYFCRGTGGLEVRLLGALQVARMVGTPAMNQGEVLRYLAELPLFPDAILANRALDWAVVDSKTITVATGSGASRGEITFVLGDDGLILTASTKSRIYSSKDGPVARPWHGRFWDYQRADGRLVPMQAEAVWTLDGEEFVYWRGHIFNWVQPPRSNDPHQAGLSDEGAAIGCQS
jgi:hypothetical protein